MLIDHARKIRFLAVTFAAGASLSACTSTELASVAASPDAAVLAANETSGDDLKNGNMVADNAVTGTDDVQTASLSEANEAGIESSIAPLALAPVEDDETAELALAAFPVAPGDPPISVNITTRSETPPPEIDQLIKKYSRIYGVPEDLVHYVAHRESTYDPTAFSKGNFGLMQIRYKTAKGLGYDGTPKGLFDAETNLKYAVKYLRNAWIVADKDDMAADWLYRTGYYYEAKRKGKLGQLAVYNREGLY